MNMVLKISCDPEGREGNMRKNLLGLLTFCFAFFLVIVSALAQTGGYTIQTPGQLPTYVTTSYRGGATIQTPGQLPTYVTPNYRGGYTVQTPGQLPTYINPQ